MCCCCGLGQVLHVTPNLGTPSPKGCHFTCQSPISLAVTNICKFPKSDSLRPLPPSPPENLHIMLACSRGWSLALLPQLTFLWGSVDLNGAPESFQSHISPRLLPSLRVHHCLPNEQMVEQIPTWAKCASQAVVKNGSVS